MSESNDLARYVDRLSGVRAVCVGDVMLDRFVYGHVERISPEAPIPVLRIEREEAMLGGLGNVVRNLVGVGAAVEFISVVGHDPAGHEITTLVGKLDGVEPHLLVERRRQTTIKTRFVAGSQQLLRADRETTSEVAPSSAEDVLRLASAAIAEGAVVVLSDYAKGVLTPATTSGLIAAARRARKPVIVDPKGADYARYRGASVLTPNRRELGEATGMPVDSEREIEEAARALLKATEVSAVVCTRGADGMTLVEAGRKVHHLPAEAREVFDVSGAGDTVLAVLAAGLGAGMTLLDAARLANVAAGIVVAKVGTAVAYADDIRRALLHEEMASNERKIATLAQAADIVARWRRQGLRVGFTNGVFDLLHPGHVSLLAQAKAACDRLIIGVNSDASVKRLKGEARPVQGEAARTAVLASLADADLVVVFGEDTPIGLIEAFRPDVLVKGADYTIDKVVGADEVRSWGGRVLLADLSPGHSTTATIKKMAG